MQTTMTASEFEKNVEQLLTMVRNGTDLTLKVFANQDNSKSEQGWSRDMQAIFAQPFNPNARAEPDPFAREDDFSQSNVFESDTQL